MRRYTCTIPSRPCETCAKYFCRAHRAQRDSFHQTVITSANVAEAIANILIHISSTSCQRVQADNRYVADVINYQRRRRLTYKVGDKKLQFSDSQLQEEM